MTVSTGITERLAQFDLAGGGRVERAASDVQDVPNSRPCLASNKTWVVSFPRSFIPIFLLDIYYLVDHKSSHNRLVAVSRLTR
jgi:hypothetical protein